MMTTTSARLLLIAAASSSLAVFPVGADAARTTRDRIRPNKEIGILSYPGEISHVFQVCTHTDTHAPCVLALLVLHLDSGHATVVLYSRSRSVLDVARCVGSAHARCLLSLSLCLTLSYTRTRTNTRSPTLLPPCMHDNRTSRTSLAFHPTCTCASTHVTTVGRGSRARGRAPRRRCHLWRVGARHGRAALDN